MKRGVRDLDTAAESRVRVEHAVGVLNEAAKTRHFKRRLALEPKDADPTEVARAIVKIIETPPGKRPFRVHIDPSQDGAEIVNGVADRVRRELLRRMGLEDLLSPSHELPSGRI